MAISRSMMERQLRAGGGIMTLDEPRQGYFLGKLVKKAKRAVKKVVKSPLGKAALIGGLGAFGLGSLGGGTGFLGRFAPSAVGKGISSLFGTGGKLSTIGNLFKVGGKETGALSIPRLLTGLGIGGAIAAPFLMGGDEEEVDPGVDVTGIQPMVASIRDQARAYYTDPASRASSGLFFMPQQQFTRPFASGGLADIPREGYDNGGDVETVMKDYSDDPNYKGWLKLYEKNPEAAMMNENAQEYLRFYNSKAEGGIMDLGGMEKDYREGGFVPIGKEERADDVPARLSKNEFVFTADAVRNAGGGDIDKGAEVMQNMMDNLEAGGMISEESQGKENPAQAMFDQAQMLESRIV
jgi:hypothetical protein